MAVQFRTNTITVDGTSVGANVIFDESIKETIQPLVKEYVENEVDTEITDLKEDVADIKETYVTVTEDEVESTILSNDLGLVVVDGELCMLYGG